MNNKNITRTAAIIFSEESSAIKAITVQRKIVESIFVANQNSELTIDEIIDELQNSFEMNFDYSEVENIINDEKRPHFQVRLDSKTNENHIRLLERRYATLTEREDQYSIYPHIQKFKEESLQSNHNIEIFDDILLKYFYELLNTNIQAFKKISKPDFRTDEIYLDPNKFSIEERGIINAFLEWDNVEKNKAIFALVSYSLEYAVVTNHYESSSVFLNSIKNKVFYLDNNVLYRAIGLNGENRRKRTREFLGKCRQAGQEFKISPFTQREFKETIKHHIKALQKVPFRTINHNLFSKYSLNSGIYDYYHKWRVGRSSYSFDLFTSHIFAELDLFTKAFNVDYVYSVPFDENGKEEKGIIEKYIEEISIAKGNGNEMSHYFDAANTFLIEKLRSGNCYSLSDTKFYFVSTDQKLRSWDFSRSKFQPVALLPSQWMAILLKYFSRTDNDYSSFISFLKLKTNQPIVNEECLQTVLSGISQLTEDFQKQSTILERMVEIKFEGILNGNNKTEEVYARTIDFVHREFDNEIDQLNRDNRNSALELSRQNIEFKRNLLKEKEGLYADLTNKRGPIERRATSKYRFLKLKYCLILLIYILILIYLVIKIGWDIMEPITYLVSVGVFVASYLYIAIFGNEFNPVKYFETKKVAYLKSTYSEFHFDIEGFNSMEAGISALRAEVESLEEEHKTKFSQPI